jgi:membrane-bound lytic murein transglycosylase B
MLHFFVKILIVLSLTMTSIAYADTVFIQRKDVQEFINMMVKKYHFNKQQLTLLFSEVKIRKQIMQHINKPLEKETWNTYQRLFVNKWRIEEGVKFWNRYADVLKKAEQRYGVPASIIVSTIGIETKYGERTGDYRVMDSLTNIAFSGSSRSAYFRNELMQFLLLTREEHLDPLKIMGSYAGAIGQPQFMPSSYRHYAVNFSKSGKTDLMHNEIDVIGSVANYYSKFNWTMNQPVAIHAVIIGDRYHYLMKTGKINQPFTIAELDRYGVIPSKRINYDTLKLKVRVIELPSSYKKEYWIGFHNFEVIRRYNPSDLYAMAVFQLSDYITVLRNQLNHG